MIKNLDKEASQEFLKDQGTGYLGCVLESGEPYIVPVNFIFENDSIYIHSLPGEKITAMHANPQVCLQTDIVSDDGFEWKSVIAFGKFEEIEDKNHKKKLLIAFYEKFPRFTPVEARFMEEDFATDIIVFRIKIKRLTGVAEVY